MMQKQLSSHDSASYIIAQKLRMDFVVINAYFSAL